MRTFVIMLFLGFFVMILPCHAVTEYWWDLNVPKLLPDILKTVNAQCEENYWVKYGSQVIYWPSQLEGPENQVPLIGDVVQKAERWPDFIWVPGAISQGASPTMTVIALHLPEIPQEISGIFPDNSWDVWKLEVTSTIFQSGDVIIRESPDLLSCGFYGYKALPEGGYLASSFFDVFTELSIDGGQTWTAAEGISFDNGQTWVADPVHYIGAPEPATMLLLGLGGIWLRRRR